MSAAGSQRGKVSSIDQLAPGVVQLTVQVASGSFRFAPGQWVSFRFPDAAVSRAYTIASPPDLPGSVQLCVRMGTGRGGGALQKLEVGTDVTFEGPYGDFVLPDGETLPVIFLAGDTGIAPVRSIVLSLLAANDPRALTILYEPNQKYILYSNEFDPLARSGVLVHESGRIETLIERHRNALRTSRIMISGFDPFLNRALTALSQVEVTPALVISETFGEEPAAE